MSGGDSGLGGGQGDQGDGGPTVDCSSIFERTILSSPDPTVLGGLARGEILHLEAERPDGPLLAKTPTGETAGSITSSHMLNILRCISEGWSFIATVRSVSGGACEVEIRPESA